MRPEQETSIYDMDLTKISLPGCLLFLATIVVLAIYVAVISIYIQGDPLERGPRKLISAIGFVVIAAFFMGGEFLLEKLGGSMLRKPKRKKRSKKKNPKKRKRPRLD